MRGFFEISQHKLPKRAFRAMPPTIFTEKASKTIVSCEASSKFHRTSFQKDRFVRGFLEISQKKLPKRSFRARLPRNFTEQASKKIVSCEASSKFHRTSFQKDRFVRGFVSCEASSKFHRAILLKRTFRAMLPTISTENLRLATVSCNGPPNLREGSSSKSKMCFLLQRRAIQNSKMYVLLQRRAQKSMNPAQDVQGNPRHTNHHFTTVFPRNPPPLAQVSAQVS